MIVVVDAWCTCIACPSQWEGVTNDGKWVYARYRWGVLYVQVGTDRADFRGEIVFQGTFGNSLDGYMKYSRLKELTKEVITWPNLLGNKRR